MNEDELLKILSKYWGREDNLIIPNGDDTLAIPAYDDLAYLVTVDTSLENVHFTKEILTFEEIGYRAVAGALSDIAAMGGEPVTILIDLEIPELQVESIKSIYNGIRILQDEFCFSIGGGNIVHGNRWRLTTTVVGVVKRDYILRRNNFRPGEKIYITGDIGRVYYFFRELKKPNKDEVIFKKLREKVAHPVPRIKEIRELKFKYNLGGAIDISDGLGVDLKRVAEASKVNIVIDMENIPYVKELNYFRNEENFYFTLISSGEEYEVCFSSRDEIEFPGITKIGEVLQGSGKVLGKLGNQLFEISALGYDHIKKLSTD
uniref:Thiamine-monophosphate kinase n=1 Tax=candidate division WOR-3 bacterium TaxID=2052148 RepID=A0A7C2PAR4_UNCW3